jgi:pimeloyl-ACP methyl ester carboxylesterase
VISPEGEGRRFSRYSWGSVGQVDDLARMPVIVHRALPWVHVDQHRIYAFGGSMGGQETLLLLARHPGLLAGAAAFDSVTNMALRYRNFLRVPCNAGCRRTWNGSIGRSLQSLARQEVGGTPATRPLAYSERSPATYARTIAASCVPLQLWWSVKDRIVADQQRQSAALFRRIAELNPAAPVTAFVGAWNHSAEMQAGTRLPAALVAFGLLPDGAKVRTSGLHVIAPEQVSDCVR